MATTAILLLFSIGIESTLGASDPIYGCRNLNSAQNMVLEITVDSIVNISFSGPSDVWYSYGLGNTVMAGTNIIVVNGDGTVEDRSLTGYNKGTLLTAKTDVDSTSVTDGVRSMQMHRNINDGSNFYKYPEEPGAVDIIFAWGSVEQIDDADATGMAGYGNNIKINFVANKDDVTCDSDGDAGYMILSHSSITYPIVIVFYVLYH